MVLVGKALFELLREEVGEFWGVVGPSLWVFWVAGADLLDGMQRLYVVLCGLRHACAVVQTYVLV